MRLIALLIISGVSADDCNTLCLYTFPQHLCLPSVSCRSGVCNSLFWTETDGICLAGYNCASLLEPVTCEFAGIMPPPLAQRAPSLQASASASFRPFEPFAANIEWVRARFPRVDPRLGVVEDPRPRVFLRMFSGHDQNILFPVLLDTGSSVSYMVEHSPGASSAAAVDVHHFHGDMLREAREGEGLRFRGPEEHFYAVEDRFGFGHGAEVKYVDIKARAFGWVQLVCPATADSFAEQLWMSVADKPESAWTGVGLLGASPKSALARASGSLIFHPSRTGGQLLIRRSDPTPVLASLCRPGTLLHAPMDPSVSAEMDNHWEIAGFIQVEGGADSRRELRWIVDTGSGLNSEIYVDRATFAMVTAAMAAAGAVVGEKLSGQHILVENCTEERIAQFPHVTVGVYQTDPEYREITVSFTPAEYLFRHEAFPGYCHLLLDQGDMRAIPDTRLLGMSFLNRFVTALSRPSRQVSFCTPIDQ